MYEFACGVWTGFAIAIAAFLLFSAVLIERSDDE